MLNSGIEPPNRERGEVVAYEVDRAPADGRRPGAPGAATRFMRHRRRGRQSQRVVSDIVAGVDFVLVATASVAAAWIYIAGVLDKTQSIGPYIVVGVIAALVAFAAFRNQGLYAFDRLAEFRGTIRRAFIGICVAALALLSAAYFLKISAEYSRGWMLSWMALSWMGVIANHYVMARLVRHGMARGIFARNIAIYGSGEVAMMLVEHLNGAARNVHIIGVFDDLPRGATPHVVLTGGLSKLIHVGLSARIDEVLIALPASQDQRIADLVAQMSILPISISLCPDMSPFRIASRGIVNRDGVAVLELARRPLDDWAPILKAIEDRVIAGALLVACLPIMALIALAIRIDSRGPVIFRQRRHGFNHDIITVLKFRTMGVAEDGRFIAQASREDPRVTRIGKLLRRTSLDELPQLFNVMRGEMSLVGPRPHALAHNEHYSALLERYANRHRMKPGITGWAQINGFRGETDTPEKMRLRVEHDLHYIENWSLWFDLKIILLTPFLGLVNRNAF